MTAPTPHTGLESKPVWRHRAACTCGWQGVWTDTLATAEADRDGHRRQHAGARP